MATRSYSFHVAMGKAKYGLMNESRLSQIDRTRDLRKKRRIAWHSRNWVLTIAPGGVLPSLTWDPYSKSLSNHSGSQ
jgi:hypothetical protein